MTCEGQGLHSGTLTRLTFRPSSRAGIIFVKGTTPIPAALSSVIDTHRGVTLGKDGESVKTVEHLLAALRWLGISNLEIEVNGEEIPVFDGSSRSWIETLKPHLSESEREFPSLAITTPYSIKENGGAIDASPAPELSVFYSIDFPNTPVGHQTWDGCITPQAFLQELAPARTFGFLHEVQTLWNMGLGKGGNSENCVVITKDAFLTPLRFPDEMIRHKVLDLMGDLALLPWIPKARIKVEKGSHRLHTALAKALESMTKER